MPFKIEQQFKSHWCWAAVALSIDRYFTPTSGWSQCDIASHILPPAALDRPGYPCCDRPNESPGRQPCNLDASLGDSLNTIGRSFTKAASLSFDQVRNEILKGLPVCVTVKWASGDKHAVVISGYRKANSGLELVTVRDPLHGTSVVQFKALMEVYRLSGAFMRAYFLKP
jgi:hypothetical protein